MEFVTPLPNERNQTYIVTFSVKVVTSQPVSKPTTLKQTTQNRLLSCCVDFNIKLSLPLIVISWLNMS
jgi:DNA primase